MTGFGWSLQVLVAELMEGSRMFGIVWILTARVCAFVRRWAPTNIAITAIMTRRGLKWGPLAMLLAVPYLAGVVLCAQLAADGGPGWLNLFVLLFIWNALKFAVVGPVSLLRLAHARLVEARIRRGEQVPV